MKRIPKMYNSVERDCIIKLSSRTTKLGETFFCVEFETTDGSDYVTFAHMSSALDFIQSNFKQ